MEIDDGPAASSPTHSPPRPTVAGGESASTAQCLSSAESAGTTQCLSSAESASTTHCLAGEHETKITRKGKIAYSSTPVGSGSLISPLGMAASVMAASDVQALLPDTRGIFHYHRPRLVAPGVLPLYSMSLGSRMRLANSSGDVRQRVMQRLLRPMGGAGLRALPAPRLHEPHAEPPAIREIDASSDAEDQWESDPDELVRDANAMVQRIRQRVEKRRQPGGVGKPGHRRPRAGLAQALARHQADADAVRAMGRGDADSVLRMLRDGARVDAADESGRTALHVASAAGNAQTVRLLVHMGAPVDAADFRGNTPLMLAATGARTEVVMLLLEAGADPRVGSGAGAALSMVRTRLRLLRKAGSANDAQTTARAIRECIDIMRLLRSYAKRWAAEPANAAYDAFRAASGELEPVLQSDSAQLDELSAQLTTLGLESQRDRDEAQMDELLDKFTLLLG
ncbi:hypothetical protein LPJ63_005010 [Coemansia sp. RSA 2711]|nr:hypothetical protein LPJ63_005010 [Coemansia sp. RSA 2711]